MATVNGTNNSDLLKGGGGADTINGLGGDDTLKGGGGADRLDGGNGIDTASYINSAGSVTVNLTTGQGFGGEAEGDRLISIENVTGSSLGDALTGDGGRNELAGMAGTDALKGGGGDDSLDGGDDNDNLKGGGGADRLVGGAGLDTADYSDSSVGVFISLMSGTGSGGDAAGDTFSGIENLTGSSGNDHLNGDNGANRLTGGFGNDMLEGYGGQDTLIGGSGDDLLIGGSDDDPDADVMSGEIGDDTYIVGTSTDVVIEAGGEGYDRVYTKTNYVLGAGCEVEWLKAENRDDSPVDVVGNEFSQSIVGNEGSNTIVGSSDQDGGLYDGLDIMTGNGGGDVFVWSSTAESGVAGNEADVITDFNRLQGDLIAVNPIDADVTAAGNQAFTFVGTGPFTAAGQVSYFTTATDTYVLLNTDGDAAQEMTIRLVGVHAVDASWFVL